MKKYLVIANTFQRGYGCEFVLFGIFDTKDDAVKWIIEHPVVIFNPNNDMNYSEKFSFFHGFEDGVGEYYVGRNGEKVVYGLPMTKEEYALRYISEFDGNPVYIGGYIE